MPVIEALPQAVKIGANFVPQTAETNGVVQASAQAALTGPALIPMGVALVPAPLFGIAISILMTKLKGLPAEMAQKVVSIIATLQAQYNSQYSTAVTKRAAAQTKLYNDLITAQTKIKKEVTALTAEIATLTTEIATLTTKKQTEYEAYEATIYDYAAKVKAYKAVGENDEAQVYTDKIAALDDWLAEITLMATEIINDKLLLKTDKSDLEEKTTLANMNIENDWDKDCDLATDFSVAIPYYPDLPSEPQYPSIPKFPEIPDQLRTYEKQFAKWLVCPLIPPIGVTIASLLLMIKEKAPNSPVTAAQLDAQAEAMIPRLGGTV